MSNRIRLPILFGSFFCGPAYYAWIIAAFGRFAFWKSFLGVVGSYLALLLTYAGYRWLRCRLLKP